MKNQIKHRSGLLFAGALAAGLALGFAGCEKQPAQPRTTPGTTTPRDTTPTEPGQRDPALPEERRPGEPY